MLPLILLFSFRDLLLQGNEHRSGRQLAFFRLNEFEIHVQDPAGIPVISQNAPSRLRKSELTINLDFANIVEAQTRICELVHSAEGATEFAGESGEGLRSWMRWYPLHCWSGRW
jgi:hypothetical protein